MGKLWNGQGSLFLQNGWWANKQITHSSEITICFNSDFIDHNDILYLPIWKRRNFNIRFYWRVLNSLQNIFPSLQFLLNKMKEIEQFYPKTRKQWRKWLMKNHQSQRCGVGGFYNKKSTNPSISWTDAVDEALCFGWIDSVKKSLDTEASIQFSTSENQKVHGVRSTKKRWWKVDRERPYDWSRICNSEIAKTKWLLEYFGRK